MAPREDLGAVAVRKRRGGKLSHRSPDQAMRSHQSPDQAMSGHRSPDQAMRRYDDLSSLVPGSQPPGSQPARWGWDGMGRFSHSRSSSNCGAPTPVHLCSPHPHPFELRPFTGIQLRKIGIDPVPIPPYIVYRQPWRVVIQRGSRMSMRSNRPGRYCYNA